MRGWWDDKVLPVEGSGADEIVPTGVLSKFDPPSRKTLIGAHADDGNAASLS